MAATTKGVCSCWHQIGEAVKWAFGCKWQLWHSVETLAYTCLLQSARLRGLPGGTGGEGTRKCRWKSSMCVYLDGANILGDHHTPLFLIITWDVDGSACINDSTVWPHAVSARRRRLNLETHISFCWVGKLEICGDHVWKWACGEQKDEVYFFLGEKKSTVNYEQKLYSLQAPIFS